MVFEQRREVVVVADDGFIEFSHQLTVGLIGEIFLREVELEHFAFQKLGEEFLYEWLFLQPFFLYILAIFGKLLVGGKLFQQRIGCQSSFGRFAFEFCSQTLIASPATLILLGSHFLNFNQERQQILI